MYNTGISNNPNRNKSENQHKIYWREITAPYLSIARAKMKINLFSIVAHRKSPNITKVKLVCDCKII